MSVEWGGAVYLSLAEACERYRLSRLELRKLIRSHGVQRYRRLGENRLYVSLAELEAVR